MNTTNMTRDELCFAISKLILEKDEAVRAVRETFVQNVIDFEGGCLSGKNEFIEYCGLTEFVPSYTATFTVTAKWQYGETEPEESYVVSALEDAAMNELPETTEVKVTTVEWNA